MTDIVQRLLPQYAARVVMMNVSSLAIPDIKLIVPKVFCDERGSFSETYSQHGFAASGLAPQFVQDNQVASTMAGTVRGLHFQIAPHHQGKLIRVAAGAILDVAVDIRSGSPTYGQHVAVELSASGGEQLWVPSGFAHGYCTLKPHTVVLYKTTAHYFPDADRGLQWDDPALSIAWPVSADRAILSDKDRKQAGFGDLVSPFAYP